MLIACDAGQAAPTPQPKPAPKATITTAQQHVLDQFDPAIVGELAPRAVDAGTYAMALTVSYDVFPTMEMRISGSSTGSLTLVLTADGKATACAKEDSREGSEGQWHYEPADKRTPYHEHKSANVVGMSGSWSVIDGTTLIAFDANVYNTCDPTNAQPAARHPMYRCIATAATKILPADTVACVETNPFVQLGMPMSTKERDPHNGRPMGAPHGQEVLLSPGKLNVTVEESRSPKPTFTFAH
jgi:hypothetical protein